MARSSIQHLMRDVHRIKEESIDRVPHHFTMKHAMGAAFGAIVFGLTFVPKGLFIDVTAKLTQQHIWAMLAAILIILSGDIYFIGYAHVKDKSRRHFGQFWSKRIIAYTIIGFAVSLGLIYLYGLNYLVLNATHLQNLVVALALPCCIGASIADLLEQY